MKGSRIARIRTTGNKSCERWILDFEYKTRRAMGLVLRIWPEFFFFPVSRGEVGNEGRSVLDVCNERKK